MNGKLVYISEDLYYACCDAWSGSDPDAGTCEWAGDVAGAYEDAPEDTRAVAIEAAQGGVWADQIALAVLRALGVPE